MRIAIVTVNEHPVMYDSGFGVEIFIYTLVHGLKAKGHDVTLYATGDSKVECKLEYIHPIGTANDTSILPEHYDSYHTWLYEKAYRNANQYDVIHGQDPLRTILFSHLLNKPSVATMHNPIKGHRYSLNIFQSFSRQSPTMLVPISSYQKKQLEPYYPDNTVIHNAIDIKNIEADFDSNKQNMFYIGRMSKNKGLNYALTTAVNTKKHIIFSGFIGTDEENKYYEEEVAPYIVANKNYIEHIPTITGGKKFKYFSSARLFLFPMIREEPFGLTLIESMATGTPVIAFARGSVPEIIKDGETGFIVNSSPDDIRGDWKIKKTGIEGLCEAVERIYSMPNSKYIEMRHACRERIEKYFTVERMVDEYEAVYEQILSRSR